MRGISQALSDEPITSLHLLLGQQRLWNKFVAGQRGAGKELPPGQDRIMSSSSFRDLRPQTRGITFAGRPQSALSRSLSRSSRSSVQSSLVSSVKSVRDPTLTPLEIEGIIYRRVNENEEDVTNAFLTLDTEQNFTVTRGEFYRVLQNFILPLTESQFNELLEKIPVNNNGTIPYLDFLAKFLRTSSSATCARSVKRSWSCSQANQVLSLNELEIRLKNTVSKNLKNVVRSCRLFDYNQNGQIQKQELRRILENCCFKMKTAEFEKLWNRYCIGKKNTLDYRELLRNLGVNVELHNKPTAENVASALNWEAVQREQQKEKNCRPPPPLKELSAEDYTIDDIEAALRKKISASYPNLVKAFRAFDGSHSGYVSAEALQSVINNFIFPLPNGTFQKLMNRLAIKCTDRIGWEQFLRRFQGPESMANGQTIPMKPNHRVNPVRGESPVVSSEHILQKLQRHFQDAYPSLKQAFLVLDEGRKGRISRKELRRIVDCMMFRVTDAQFKELMIILDPQHTGFISYLQFLDLFEDKESVSGHKWLHNMRTPLKETPVTLEWEKMGNILCEKIEHNWADFSKAMKSCDSAGCGMVDKDQFKRILQSFCPPLSDRHYNMLCEQYNDGANGYISYMDFLRNVGVCTSAAGDFNGVSTEIVHGSQLREELRQDDLSARMKEIESQATQLVKKMPVEEVIGKLKDCVIGQEFSPRESFLAFAKQHKGRISKKDFRKVLREHEIHLDEDQFKRLTEKLGFTKEELSYLDFVSLFEDPTGNGPGAALDTGSNHHVNDTKFHYMSAEDCLAQLRDKLQQGYGDLYSAFYKIDSNRDGLVTMHDFRHLLDSFMFIIKPQEFQRLLGLLGLNLSSTLNYKEFLHLFQKPQSPVYPPWLQSSHSPKQSMGGEDLACEQAHYYLVTKAQGRWHDMAKTFCEIDSEGNGIVQKKDLRNVLFRFYLPIHPKEFEKLWGRYDPEGKGFLTHNEFLEKLGISFASGDSGPSKQITEDNRACLEGHYNNQLKIQEEMDAFHKHQTKALDMKDIEQQIKDKFRDYYHDFSAAFAKIDRNKDGQISVHDLRAMLQSLNFHLDDEQFANLLYRLRIKVTDNKLSYPDFLRMIDDGRASKYGQRQRPVSAAETPPKLSLQKVLLKLKEAVVSSHDALYKAFSSFDRDGTGTIKASELHQILDSFCFKLSDRQFGYLLSKLPLGEEQTIDWKAFLHHFSTSHPEPSSSWVERVQHATRPRSTQGLTMKDILSHIREVVTARFYTVAQDFISLDYANINAVSKEDFRELFNKDFMLLTDEQFENLWNTLPLNPYGNLKYHEFLSQFGGGDALVSPYEKTAGDQSEFIYKPASALAGNHTPPESQAGIRRPKTAPAILNKPKTDTQRPKTAGASSRLVNCEQIEARLRGSLQKVWQKVLRACRDHDPERTGEITTNDFSGVLKQFNAETNEEELERLTVKYDSRNNGKFSYADFFRNIMLGPKPLEKSPLHRMKVQKTRVPISTGPDGPCFLNAMMRIQPKVLDCWRPMRRAFLSFDEARTGFISVQEFKQVLRKSGLNLSEDEFFHILGFFDKDLKAKVSYNDFLRAFLR
ncbi:EF-hand calcium-binding domain-containing protein 6 [Xenopus tropicalis]|uniref:EF-hand calcium-binding domain-containing protein 6 n=7 Tax=Xenopus tropicalis TaxID=8364 RepID=A0A8J1J7W9_XENTR|nr:EF-hand calcium-binding domain-containing protein 6 [Xenopus tropicalis]